MNKKNIKKSEMFTVKEVVSLLIITCIANVTIFFLINLDKNKITYNGTVNEIIKEYEYIKENYYAEIDEDKLINGAIKGMTEALGDNYSSFIEDVDSDTYDITLNGEYVGVGIQIMQYADTNQIEISEVFENSPAFDSGLKVGDVIKSINGISTENMSVTDLGDYIKNGNIIDFDIVINRNGEEQNIKTRRGKITINSVHSELMEKDGKKIGYLLIDTFALNTDEQFKTKLKELEDANMDSLIIDVRANTGGHLSTVTNIISEFLDKSKTIYQTDTKGKIEKIKSKGDKTKNYKIVLLGDGASASASEVLIAALKESYGATFVGTTTFGKGTVQEMHSIESTGENYKITTKKWLTPNGNWINEKGINPDHEVFLENSYFENPTNENDNQIQKALDLLK